MILRPFGSTVLSFTVVALLWATAVWAVQDSAAVALVVKDIRTAPGRQIEIGIEQSGRDLPSGYFYTVAAVATLYPGSQEPEILPGYPVTRLTCRSPVSMLSGSGFIWSTKHPVVEPPLKQFSKMMSVSRLWNKPPV